MSQNGENPGRGDQVQEVQIVGIQKGYHREEDNQSKSESFNDSEQMDRNAGVQQLQSSESSGGQSRPQMSESAQFQIGRNQASVSSSDSEFSDNQGNKSSIIDRKSQIKSEIGKVICDADGESDILSLEQDNYWELMDQLHPLRGAEMADIFPLFHYFKAYKDEKDLGMRNSEIFDQQLDRKSKLQLVGKERRQSVRQSMRKQRTFLEQAIAMGTGTVKQLEDLTIKSRLVKNSEKVIAKLHGSDDPLRELGPGISTYHQLLTMLFILFLILTCMHVPIMRTFRSYSFYDQDGDGMLIAGGIFSNSLGNMGFAQTNCVTFSMIKGNTGSLRCSAGYVNELVDWGIITHFEDKMQCARKADNICLSVFNDKHVRQKYNDVCKGKQECTLSEFETFIVKEKTIGADPALAKKCGEASSRLFFQFMCKQSREQLADKKEVSQACIDVEIATSILLIGFLFYSKKATKELTARYDENNVTPSDYTLYFQMGEEQSKVFDRIFYQADNPNSSRGQQFRDWIRHQVAVFNKVEQIKVARTDLVFDNFEMIRLLKERGQAIKNSDSGTVFQTEHKINLLKPQQYHSPVCGVFITFEDDKNVREAQQIINDTKLQIFGKEIKVKRASEPSNYIWENMAYSKRRQRIAFWITMSAFGIVLFFGYKVQFKMQQSVSYFDNYEKFDCQLFHNSLPDQQKYYDKEDVKDSNIDRDSLDEMEASNAASETGQDDVYNDAGTATLLQKIPHYTKVKYQKEAYHTWKNFYEPTDKTTAVANYVNGTLSCFCDDEYRQHGYLAAYKDYRLDGIDQLPGNIQQEILRNEAETESQQETNQICKNYVVYQKFSQSYYVLTSLVIIIYNGFFYTMTKPVISYIGFHKVTKENSWTSLSIFCCLCVDMIVLPMMIGMNLVEYYDSKYFLFSDTVFRGKHTDFGAGWYKDIGYQIVVVMCVFAFQPILDFITEYLMLRLYRWYFRHFVYNKENVSEQSKLNVVNDYLKFLDLHAGPEYCFFYKCANTNMMVFITLIFGAALPILYVISLFSIGVQYMIERLSLTYFYRIPPKFSDKLTLLNIKIMSFAPISSLFLTFWLHTNKQMFDNKIDPVKSQGELTLSHHLVSAIRWSQLNPSDRALIYAVGLVSLYLAVEYLHGVYLKFKDHVLEFQDNMLPNYFTSLKFNDCQEFLEDEEQFRRLGFKCLDDQAIVKIKEVYEKGEKSSDSEEGSLFDDLKEFDDDGANLHLSMKPREQHVAREKVANTKMVGNPCYMIFQDMTYQMEFNNQNFNDEINTKLLLMLPMVPRKYLDKIKLNHLKLYETTLKRQSATGRPKDANGGGPLQRQAAGREGKGAFM